MEWIDALYTAVGLFLGWWGKILKEKISAWAKSKE